MSVKKWLLVLVFCAQSSSNNGMVFPLLEGAVLGTVGYIGGGLLYDGYYARSNWQEANAHFQEYKSELERISRESGSEEEAALKKLFYLRKGDMSAQYTAYFLSFLLAGCKNTRGVMGWAGLLATLNHYGIVDTSSCIAEISALICEKTKK